MSFIRALGRRKTDSGDVMDSQLARVLTVVDLTALGVGSTLGVGVYVLAGAVAKNEAGPAVVLSFLVAAIASVFAGLCYAEFAARVPKAGSAYVYSYVCVGELAAFIIGWNLILEYIIGTASVARALSNYIDELFNKQMSHKLIELMPINISFLSSYPDYLSFVFSFALSVLLSIGVKESSRMNNIFTVLNLIIVVTAIIAGGIKADIKNWQIKKEDIPVGANGGEGGFMPFGFSGMMAGAAKCFYGFVGFDCVATTGEEAKNPQKSIPIAIVLSLLIIFIAYCGISTVLTMAWPYYDQNPDAPFPSLFAKLGWDTVKWIITIGAIFGLCTSLLGAMFPLPRIMYAMGKDGLLFSIFSKVHPRFQTPFIATLLSGLFAGLMAAIFNLDQLVSMMSIGTLLAYTIVAFCVLVLRCRADDFEKTCQDKICFGDVILQIFNVRNEKEPTRVSSTVSGWMSLTLSILAGCLGVCIIYGGHALSTLDIPMIAVTAVVSILLIINFISLCFQPQSKKKLSFKVPLVPLIPTISIFMNLYLMLELDFHTWIRFSVWMAVGFAIYFGYGIWHSTERKVTTKGEEIQMNGHTNPAVDMAFDEESEHTNSALNMAIEEKPKYTNSALDMAIEEKPKYTNSALDMATEREPKYTHSSHV